MNLRPTRQGAAPPGDRDSRLTATPGEVHRVGAGAEADALPGRVYVDAAVWPYGRMMMCHMVADNLDALHAMADKIGVARRWFQNKPGFPHYDICKAKRELAVQNGAVEISWRELVTLIKRPV